MMMVVADTYFTIVIVYLLKNFLKTRKQNVPAEKEMSNLQMQRLIKVVVFGTALDYFTLMAWVISQFIRHSLSVAVDSFGLFGVFVHVTTSTLCYCNVIGATFPSKSGRKISRNSKTSRHVQQVLEPKPKPCEGSDPSNRTK